MPLSEMLRLRESQLDRLLDEYDISFHVRVTRGPGSMREGSLHKMACLLEFLGARWLADMLLSESGNDWSGSRRSLAGLLR
jgi:hypothetical protein